MPGGADAVALVDTSVAVALSVADHSHHESTLQAIGDRALGLAGHAAFETYSVLTRLPPPARRSPQTVARLLAVSFPHTRHLGAEASAVLAHELVSVGVAGGAVYDALVGAAAREHDLPLFTRDQRAAETYRALEVRFELLT
ncbi:MAG TPA: type II toxin-antitoxin system VapC family toxin [Solirubrobacteraceae bacterium]|nr:type II toxin-antitoxin system VapC family toxin [Solirubrobacteraceae bacterium]